MQYSCAVVEVITLLQTSLFTRIVNIQAFTVLSVYEINKRHWPLQILALNKTLCSVQFAYPEDKHCLCQPLWAAWEWEGWRVLLSRCARLTLVNTRCPPRSSLVPLLSSKWWPAPSWAGFSMRSRCPRGELLAPMPSSSHCREAPGQFTPQAAALGWLLQRVWNSAVAPGSACAEPELPLRQSFSASMLPTRSRTHWAVSPGTNYKVSCFGKGPCSPLAWSRSHLLEQFTSKAAEKSFPWGIWVCVFCGLWLTSL